VHQAFIVFYLSDPEAIWTQAITDRIQLLRTISSPSSQDPYPPASEVISGPTLLLEAGGIMFIYGAPIEDVPLKYTPDVAISIGALIPGISLRQPENHPEFVVTAIFNYLIISDKTMAISHINEKLSPLLINISNFDFSYDGNVDGPAGYIYTPGGSGVELYKKTFRQGIKCRRHHNRLRIYTLQSDVRLSLPSKIDSDHGNTCASMGTEQRPLYRYLGFI
jgi:hypothetical protein